MNDPLAYIVRRAIEADSKPIKDLIRAVEINPLGVKWENFLVAIDSHSRLIGCGQIKPHQDGSYELSSIAVVEKWRMHGIATNIIQQLIESHQGTLFLTCRSTLESFYQRFGFFQVSLGDMPPYFRRISRIAALFQKSRLMQDALLVMKRNP